MDIALHLPDDIVESLAWQDISRHLLEQIALEGYQTGRLNEEQVRRLLDGVCLHRGFVHL